MKKTIALICITVITAMVSLTGCGVERGYDYDLSKYVKVGQYKGLEYKKPDKVKVTQQEINEAIGADLDQNQYLKDVEDKKVHDGDTINIDYTGTVDGKEFEGGSAEGTSLVVGKDNFIDGFTKGLIGKKVGSTVTLNLKFPDPYSANEDLSGKKVKFKVKINSSQEYVTPTEKYYVKHNTEYGTVAKYEKAKKEALIDQKKEEQQATIQEELWKKIYDSSKVTKYPDKEVQDYINQTKKSIDEYAKQYNLTFDDFIKQYYNMEKKDYNKQVKQVAKENAKAHMIVYAIADQEKISVSGKEYDEFIEKQMKEIGYSEEQFEEYTGQTYEEYVGGSENIIYYLTYEKVMKVVQDNATAK